MTSNVTHPLEPLTADEVKLAVTILRDSGKVTPTTRFVSVHLKEPAKEVVHRFHPGATIAREAFALLFDNAKNACYEVVVSLAERKVTSWKHVPGVQPTMTF